MRDPVSDTSDVLALADVYGCSVDWLASTAGMPAEQVASIRGVQDVKPGSAGELARLTGLLDQMKEQGLDPVPWLDTLILDGVPIRRRALYTVEPELLNRLISESVKPVTVLNRVWPGWRTGYNYKKPAVGAGQGSREVE